MVPPIFDYGLNILNHWVHDDANTDDRSRWTTGARCWPVPAVRTSATRRSAQDVEEGTDDTLSYTLTDITFVSVSAAASN